MRTHVLKHMVIGARVVRGLDWKWRDQDGAQGAEGKQRILDKGKGKENSESEILSKDFHLK